MESLLCTRGNDYFTQGRYYPLTNLDRLAVYDDENDSHDINTLCGQYTSYSHKGGAAIFEAVYDTEETSPNELEKENNVNEPIYLYSVKHLNTYMRPADVEDLGKIVRVYARTAEEAFDKVRKAVEKPINSQQVAMKIQSIEEVL